MLSYIFLEIGEEMIDLAESMDKFQSNLNGPAWFFPLAAIPLSPVKAVISIIQIVAGAIFTAIFLATSTYEYLRFGESFDEDLVWTSGAQVLKGAGNLALSIAYLFSGGYLRLFIG